ncbi:hypothetical protein HYX06_01430 [Candidatus Woesearchaeota archaeon]|nr:hypothetical protein [Candidatus Woesearchaeota archaeon]
MSAEKEIVNYWYNKKGLFTVNNIKTSSNRDCGILALKFDKDKVNEVLHVEVSCSITNNMSANRKAISEHAQKPKVFDISDTANLDKSVGKIIEDKFNSKDVQSAIGSYIRNFSLTGQNIRRVLVLGAVPKSRKSEIIEKFNEKNVQVIEFENIIYDVIEKLDTQYYKNDIIRTLQLTKYLLLSEPSKAAKLLVNDSFTSASRKEFLASILDSDEILKEFKKTNVERLAAIVKNVGLKPDELAKMLEHNILNKRTRRLFLNSLNEQEKIRKVVSKIIKKKKAEASLQKFF